MIKIGKILNKIGLEHILTAVYVEIDNLKAALSGKANVSDIPKTLPANGGNSTTVNGHSVNSDVPANAKFTDTVYSLPTASSAIKGGVKVGYSQNGKNYPVQLNNEQMYVNVPWTNTAYTVFRPGSSVSPTGESGLVPAPSYTDATLLFLSNNGNWEHALDPLLKDKLQRLHIESFFFSYSGGVGLLAKKPIEVTFHNEFDISPMVFVAIYINNQTAAAMYQTLLGGSYNNAYVIERSKTAFKFYPLSESIGDSGMVVYYNFIFVERDIY